MELSPEKCNRIVRGYLNSIVFEGDEDILDMLYGVERNDIIRLRRQAEMHYGFALTEVECYYIWQWHSLEWHAGWLGVSHSPESNMRYFDEFFEKNQEFEDYKEWWEEGAE